MKKYIPLLFLAAMISSCMDDMDYDKISDKVNVSPTLLLPLATADVDIEYLFDEADNAVEYYTAEDGTKRVKLKANHDSIAEYPLFDFLGISREEMTFEHTFDWTSYDMSYATTDVELNADMEIPVVGESAGIEVKSAKASYEVTAEYSGFEHAATIKISFAGKEMVIEASGDAPSGVESMKGLQQDIELSDGKIGVGMSLTSPAGGSGRLGEIKLSVRLTDISSITGSTDGLVIPTETYISLTYMQEFRRFGRNVTWKNPQLWLTCTNNTPLDGKMEPTVASIGDGRVLLEATEYNIPAGTVGYESVINKENSNIEGFFKNVPDSLTYDADILLSMPSGSDEVTIKSSDMIYVGYRYDVPFEFMVDSEIDCDTVMISDIPDLDMVTRARLVSNVVNSIPCGGSFILQLVNLKKGEEYSKIDVDGIIGIPEINSNGVSTSTVESVKTVDLSDDNIADLGRADAMIVSVYLGTNDMYVAPKLEDRLQVDIAIAVEIEISNE